MSVVPTKKSSKANSATGAKEKSNSPPATAAQPSPVATPDAVEQNPVLAKAEKLLEQGRPKDAFELLNAKSSLDPVLRNARGVCLLRMQQPQLAVRAFREIVLATGSIGLRWNIPLHYKTNLALSLLLDKNVAGCASVLNETGQRDDPRVQRLLNVMRRWESGLTVWQRFMWRLGVEPNVPVTIDFVPGDLR